jgi:hypothetical protein
MPQRIPSPLLWLLLLSALLACASLAWGRRTSHRRDAAALLIIVTTSSCLPPALHVMCSQGLVHIRHTKRVELAKFGEDSSALLDRLEDSFYND